MTRMVEPARGRRSPIPPEESQVRAVGQVLHFKAFNRSNIDDKKKFSFLARVIKAVMPKEWLRSPNSALIDIFRLAINRLPDDEFPEEFDKNWQWIAKVLYGYVEEEKLPRRRNGSTHTYKSRYAHLKKLYAEAVGREHPDTDFKRRVIWPIGATLVEILKELEREGPTANALRADEPVAELESKAEMHVQPTSSNSAVSDLLRAQLAVAQSLAYWPFRADMPQLDDVFVNVLLERSDSGLASIDAVLAHSNHVLILGEPGSGKTTVAAHEVASRSHRLLNVRASPGPYWLPLYVPARLLLGSGPFPGLIATGLQTFLTGVLASEIDYDTVGKVPDGFSGWLVFVDGLDEVVDVEARRRLLWCIGQQMSNPSYRFVLLSRPLPSEELTPVLTHVDNYRVAALTQQQLLELAQRWFDAQGVADATAQANSFANWCRRCGFEESLLVPLLATIACVVYASKAGHKPSTLPDLYEQFVSYLLYGRQSSVRTLESIRSQFRAFGAGAERLADWLFDNRRQICEQMALQLLDGGSGALIAVADKWVRDNAPYFCLVPEWSSYLRAVLIDSSLVVWQGGDFVFIHRTIAEYLAAPLAGLPGAIEDCTEWVQARVANESYMDFRVFAWAKSHDYTELIHKALGHFYDGYELTASLGVKGLPLDSYTIGKLIDFMEVGWKEVEDYSVSVYGCPVRRASMVRYLGRLASRYERIAECLTALAQDTKVDDQTRLEALKHLVRGGHYAVATQCLDELRESSNLDKQVVAAALCAILGETSEARRIAVEVLERTTGYEHVPDAAYILLNIGDSALALEYLDGLLTRPDWSRSDRMILAQTRGHIMRGWDYGPLR